jgi:hypothetical protein
MLLLQFASWRSVNLHLICGDFLSCEPRFYTNSIFAWYGTLFALVDRDSGPSLTFPFMLCGPRRCTKTISKILCVGRLVSWTPGPLRFQLNFCCTRKDKEIHLSNFQAYALSRKLEFFWLLWYFVHLIKLEDLMIVTCDFGDGDELFVMDICLWVLAEELSKVIWWDLWSFKSLKTLSCSWRFRKVYFRALWLCPWLSQLVDKFFVQ